MTQQIDESQGSISLTLRSFFFFNTGDLFIFLILLSFWGKNEEILSGYIELIYSPLNFFDLLDLINSLRVFSKPPPDYLALLLLLFFHVYTTECGERRSGAIEEEASWSNELEESVLMVVHVTRERLSMKLC